jgi:predicted transposase YbfD/YdcC
MHQLALSEPQTGVILKEQVSGEKQNELSIVSPFLTPFLVKGRLISADALHTQCAFCLKVRRWEGDYVLEASGNQSTLRDDFQLFFRDPPADCRDWRTARTVDKSHGRLEMRELVATTELHDFLAKPWIGVAQVFRLTRTVQKGEQTHIEVVSCITSLAPEKTSAQWLLHLVREHWAIENRLRLSARCHPARRSLSSAQGRRSPPSGSPHQFSVGCARFLGRLQCPQADTPL